MTVTEFLKQQVPFLSGLTEDQAHFLATSAEQLVFNKGQTVIFRGVTVDGLHVIAAGKVTVHAKVGKETLQVAELGPGQVFGETSIIEMTVAGATIKSAEDETLIFVLPEEAFKQIMGTDAGFTERVMALIAERKKANADRNEKKP
ncbi:MAG: cyclic nucleotide-binding domain-containing protein [Elusimicrobia bacterium]|nr:cyclic nucleotide-binding domain-containing protein [Elusimicrobiota bacterium]